METIKKRKQSSVSLKVLLFVVVVLTVSFSAQTFMLAGQVSDEMMMDDGMINDDEMIEEEMNQSITLEDVKAAAADKEWLNREEKEEAYTEGMKEFANIARAFSITMDGYRQKRAEIRTVCTNDLRTANKFTLLTSTEECWLEDLQIEKVILEKERDYISQIPGIQEDVRLLALTRVDLLNDALGVLINAIENQVYTSVEELEAVKQLLSSNYRKAKWTMDLRIQADLLRTKTNSIILKVGSVLEESDVGPEMSVALLDSLSCYVDAENILITTVKSITFEDTQLKLLEAKQALLDCGESARFASAQYENPTEKDTQEVTDEEPISELPETEPTHSSATNNTSNGKSFIIHGLEDNKYKEVTEVKNPYVWDLKPGYQVDGPTANNCDTSTLSRRLVSKMPKDENGNPICRTSEEYSR